MAKLSRRSVLGGSLALAATGSLARPHIANAQTKTANVWWVQGFAEEEDVAFKKMVTEYEKASGNTLDYSIIPYAPERQKIVSAVTSGAVPDLFQNNPFEIVALFAWDDKLIDVSDVVNTQKEEYTEAALLSAYCYNGVEKRRSYYGVPYTAGVSANHIWRSLVEKAGYKIEDIPKNWDDYYDFFKGVQRKLREHGVRNVYGLGFQVTTNGVDPNSTFNNFLIAYGGQNIVTKDGKLHLDDPQVREAAIKALTYPTTAYKEGFVPPSAINWNDADDNNAFHAKTIVMDLDGSISTEVAIYTKKEEYDDIAYIDQFVVPGEQRDDLEGVVLEQVRHGAAGHRRDDLLALWRIRDDAVVDRVAAGLLVVGDDLLERDVFFLGEALDPPDSRGRRLCAGDIRPRQSSDRSQTHRDTKQRSPR